MRKLTFLTSLLIANSAFAQSPYSQPSHASAWIWVAVVFVICTIGYYIAYKKFNEDGSRELLKAAPGICTSIGILGTFFSICYSLWNIDSQNFELTQIIDKLIPAFTTSIAGIILAILATIINKIQFAKQDARSASTHRDPEENLYRIAEGVKELCHKFSTVSQIADSLDTMMKQQKQQTDVISGKQQILINSFSNQEKVSRELNQRLTTTISEQSVILEKFVNDFVERMDEIFSNMKESISQQMNNYGEKQFSESRQILESIMSRLSQYAGSMLEAQADAATHSMHQTNAALSEISSNISEGMNRLSEASRLQMESIIAAQNEKLQSLLDLTAAQSRQLQEAADTRTRAFEQKLQESYDSISQHNADSLTQMVALRDAYAEISDDFMKRSQAQQAKLADSVNSGMKSMVEKMESHVQAACQSMADNIVTYLNTLRENYSFISDQLASIKSNYEQSVLSFADAVENAHDTNRAQESLLQQVNSGVANLTSTNGNIEKMLSVIENRQEKTDHLIQRISDVSAAIVSMQQLESVLQRVTAK